MSGKDEGPRKTEDPGTGCDLSAVGSKGPEDGRSFSGKDAGGEGTKEKKTKEKKANGKRANDKKLLVEPESFLGNLRGKRETYPRAKIVFHNDMDGFASSLLVKQLLESLGYSVEPENIVPMSHVRMDDVSLDSRYLYFFVDIRPHLSVEETGGGKRPILPDNIFCVDHHMTQAPLPDRPDHFLIYYSDREDIVPSTATSLMYYLAKWRPGEVRSYGKFMENALERASESERFLILQATIADHLHLLSPVVPDNPLRQYLESSDVDLDAYVKLSIVTSLLLGRGDATPDVLRSFHTEDIRRLDESYFSERLKGRGGSVETLFDFVRTTMGRCKEFARDIKEETKNNIEELRDELKTKDRKLGDYVKAKRSAREAASDPEEEPRINEELVYSQEIKKLGKELKIISERIDKLRERYDSTGGDGGTGVAIFIPPQDNGQVRGILSSLFYFEGWRNIILEEGTSKDLWSSRGYGRAELEENLTTITIDPKEFKDYKNLEEAKAKHPDIFDGPELKGKHKLTVEERYIGEMGGRRKIFGGFLKSALSPEALGLKRGDEEDKEELIRNLPDDRFWGSTVQGIKTKFKRNDWNTIQVKPGSHTGDILEGKWEMLIIGIGGNNRTVRRG